MVTGMLASVTSLDEAHLVHRAGADIIDLKNPAQGALGALPLAQVREIVTAYGTRACLSATIGDLPAQPECVHDAAKVMAATGVNYVKVGLFPSPGIRDCIQALQPLCINGVRLVMVLFADQQPGFNLLPAIAAVGCAGVMLDTADKRCGGLRACLAQQQLAEFVVQARECSLLVGLAGSLQADDISALLPLGVDYLGFRGALCRRGQRTDQLDPAAVRQIRARLYLPTAARTM